MPPDANFGQPMCRKKAGADPTGAALVIGGGISGMQASLDLANTGFKVCMVEKNSAIGVTLDFDMARKATRGYDSFEILKMLEVVVGGAEQLRINPTAILYLNPTIAFRHNKERCVSSFTPPRKDSPPCTCPTCSVAFPVR